MIRNFNGPPSTGVDWAYTVPTSAPATVVLVPNTDYSPANMCWRIRSLCAPFTASAAVANRSIDFRILDEQFIDIGHFPVPFPLTAGQSAIITWGSGLVTSAALVNGNLISVALPIDIVMRPNMKFLVTTTNLQAGDVWGAQRLLFEEVVQF